MIDLGKFIGGPDEGDGIVGAMLGLFALGGAGAAAGVGTGFFDGVGGAADGMAAGAWDFGGAAASHEGWFASFLERSTFVDWYFMYDAAKGSFSRDTQQAWSALSGQVKEVISAHGFIRQQLHIHGNAELAAEYERLGTDLPSKDLLKRAYHALANKLHGDKNPLEGKLMATLNNAKDTLDSAKSAHKIREYEHALRSDNAAVKEFFAGFDTMDTAWKQAYETAASAERIAKGHLLEGPAGAARAERTFKQVIGDLSTTQKVGIVFAGAMTVGLGVLVGVKLVERHRQKKQMQEAAFTDAAPLSLVDSVSPQERIHAPHHATNRQ